MHKDNPTVGPARTAADADTASVALPDSPPRAGQEITAREFAEHTTVSDPPAQSPMGVPQGAIAPPAHSERHRVSTAGRKKKHCNPPKLLNILAFCKPVWSRGRQEQTSGVDAEASVAVESSASAATVPSDNLEHSHYHPGHTDEFPLAPKGAREPRKTHPAVVGDETPSTKPSNKAILIRRSTTKGANGTHVRSYGPRRRGNREPLLSESSDVVAGFLARSFEAKNQVSSRRQNSAAPTDGFTTVDYLQTQERDHTGENNEHGGPDLSQMCFSILGCDTGTKPLETPKHADKALPGSILHV